MSRRDGTFPTSNVDIAVHGDHDVGVALVCEVLRRHPPGPGTRLDLAAAG